MIATKMVIHIHYKTELNLFIINKNELFTNKKRKR
jgi:hypothetical protein